MESQISTPEGIFKIVPQMLADVKVRLDLETSSITLPCTVQQTLAPTPRTTIRYDIPDGSSPKIQGLLFLLQWGTEPTHAMITHQGNQFRTQLLLHRTTPYVEFLIQELESLNDEDAKQTHEIGFKVINMKDTTLLGEHLASERGEGEQFGATVLSDNEWTIQLRQAPNHREAQRYLETLGGYQITHIGSIYKNDGSPFSQKVAQEEINILRSFLSFSNGSFVGLTEIQGAGQNFQPLWQVWRDHNVGWSNGSTNHSWIHAHGTNHEENEMMASLFPAFSREYQSDRNLPSLVYRYLQANQTQPDIDLQTAQVMGQTAWKLALKAEMNWGQLNQELEGYGLNLDIPDEMPNLRKLHKKNPPKKDRMKSGPSILNHIRNAHEHTETLITGTEEDYYIKALFEGWHLEQWYTEAIVLGRCGYSGRRTNALRATFQ